MNILHFDDHRKLIVLLPKTTAREGVLASLQDPLLYCRCQAPRDEFLAASMGRENIW
jgi:hypothetical protein